MITDLRSGQSSTSCRRVSVQDPSPSRVCTSFPVVPPWSPSESVSPTSVSVLGFHLRVRFEVGTFPVSPISLVLLRTSRGQEYKGVEWEEFVSQTSPL